MNNRIINNHKKLSKVIDNFNDYFQDEYENNILICILDKINNLNIDDNTKYQLSLENISNLLDTNNVYYNQDIFVESVTDYFLYNNLYNDNMINILEKVSLKKKPNLSKVKEYIDSFPKDKIKSKADIKNIIKKFYVLSKDNIIDETPNMLIWIRKGVVYSTFAVNIYLGALTTFIDYFISMNIRREDVKKMKKKLESERDLIEKKIDRITNEKKKDELEKYLREIEKNINSIEIYEESLYSEKELKERDEEEMNFESGEIIEDKINPLSDECFSKDEYYNYHHKNFIGEIVKVKNTITNLCKSRSDLIKLKQEGVISISTEDELVQFIEIDYVSMEDYMDAGNRLSYCVFQLLPYNSEEIHIDELNELANDLCEELGEIVDEDIVIHFDGNDDVINIFATLLIPIYDAVKENNMHIEMKKDLACILALEEQVKLLQEKYKEVDIKHLQESVLEEDEINFITEFALDTDVIDEEIVIESFKNMKEELYKQDSLDKFIKGSVLQESIYQLSNKKKENILRPKNRYEVLAETISLNESLSVLNEISVSNKLKLAKDNIAKNIKKMSDKEKITSRTLDNALDKFYNTIEKELTNKNREKVIKGTVLPSASSIVKIALTSGAVWFINPALSVITVLGSLAVSKRATTKEKQYILDEINIMLKVCDKKIQLAESNNDMKALEQLLRTQQKLERERQRIKYNLRRRNHPVSSY